MVTAAALHGVHKQYGGHITSGFLHSTMLPTATHARVSDDYIPGLKRPADACDAGQPELATSPKGNVVMGQQTLLAWALGIRPYKDAFFSGPQRWNDTTCFVAGNGAVGHGGYTKPEWWGVQESYPELHALVSGLVAGPIAVADGIGDSDPELVLRTCRSDGTLLKPDRPQFVIDSWWSEQAFGRGGGPKGGQVSHTQSTISGGYHTHDFTFHFVMGVALQDDFTVGPADIKLDGDVSGVAWRRAYGDTFAPPAASEVVVFGKTAPARLVMPKAESAADWGKYTLWKLAPLSCAGRGWALLGETDKFISHSPQRLTDVTAFCDDGTVPAMRVAMEGSPGEVVHLAFYEPAAKKVLAVAATIGPGGTAVVNMPPQ
jgi:hypothetical protein